MSISASQASDLIPSQQPAPSPPPVLDPALSLARQMLQRHWGYGQFRPGQEEIVAALLQGKDLLAVLPTGSGKSICFQLPALCRTGLTLIVSPLIALMEDQVASLQQKGIPAASLHSQQASGQRRHMLRQLHSLKLLYLSPETLLSQPVWQALQCPDLSIAGLILDEAHCFTQWGDSFRPAYGRLGAVRRGLMANGSARFPVAAFTATADRAARAAICIGLELKTPVQFVRSPHRPNIELQFQRVWTPRQRRQQALAFLRSQAPLARPSQPIPNRRSAHPASAAMPSGLVYVRRRRDCETLAEQFTAAGFSTTAYHGGLSSQRRRAIEQAWLRGAARGGLPFVVCTSAFGMGIDLPHCRWILHYHLPLLLEEYVQEIGRAGRDGKAATALALVSEPSGWLDPSDRQRDRAFLQALAEQQRRCRAIAKRIPATGTWEQVQNQHPEGALALALLHRQGQLHWIDPFRYSLRKVVRGSDGRNHGLTQAECSSSWAMQRLKAGCAAPWDLIEAAFQ